MLGREWTEQETLLLLEVSQSNSQQDFESFITLVPSTVVLQGVGSYYLFIYLKQTMMMTIFCPKNSSYIFFYILHYFYHPSYIKMSFVL